MAVYVEFLTVKGWFKHVLPHLRRQTRENPSRQPHCYIFDSTPMALALAKVISRVAGFDLQRPDFDLVDMKNEQGMALYMHVPYMDLEEIQSRIVQSRDFQNFIENLRSEGHAASYLAKAPIAHYDFYGPQKYQQIWHVAMLVQIARWFQQRSSDGRFLLLVAHRPWMTELKDYAKLHDAELASLGPMNLRRWQWKAFQARWKKLRWPLLKTLMRHRIFALKVKAGLAIKTPFFSSGHARLMTEYWGQLNIDKPLCHSDVFFLGPQGLNPKDVLIVFNLAVDPLNEEKLKILKSHQMAAVTLTVQSCAIDPSQGEVFRPSGTAATPPTPAAANENAQVLTSVLRDYRTSRQYWYEFFRKYNIKLYTSWITCDPNQMALADALAEAGGISSFYQRSYEPNPTPQLNAVSDIIFGFSTQNFKIRQTDGSRFNYHVATGYLGDYRFQVWRSEALKIRQKMISRGAKHIVAIFDENTVDDARWFIGHRVPQENYRFWLEKLMVNPELGVIFKPKKPNTLRRRLGPVEDLLREAEQTGRCFIFEVGALQGTYPPAAAALAADIAIHDSVSAGTAGLEAALTGTRTLLMDYEGWPVSPLYRLGQDVIFMDWDSAYEACAEYFKEPSHRPKLGDWSAMIDELDPFHDGKAAERMSWYLKELLEGLRRLEDRSTLMERVADQYAKRWGKDKVQRGTGA